jgi:DNA-binding response OmpR family regulator
VKVLIVHGDPSERKRLAFQISSLAASVFEAETTAAACKVLDREPEIVLIDWGIGRAGDGDAFIRYLRTLDERARHYVIATCRRPAPSDVTAVFAAGADDLLPAIASKEELLARIEGLNRMRAWARVLHRTNALDFTDAFDIEKLRVWRELDAIVNSELGEMLGRHLHPEVTENDPVRCTGTIPLSLSSEHLEVRLAVGLATSASYMFAKEVLGGNSAPEALADALRELANVAGGAIKRAALSDGVTITIGLPSNDDLFASPNARRWSARSDSGLHVTFAAVALDCRSRAIACSDLKERMVVARDVRNAAGMLLLSAGTSLTATTIERLQRFLASNVSVEVAETVPQLGLDSTAMRSHA